MYIGVERARKVRKIGARASQEQKAGEGNCAKRECSERYEVMPYIYSRAHVILFSVETRFGIALTTALSALSYAGG